MEERKVPALPTAAEQIPAGSVLGLFENDSWNPTSSQTMQKRFLSSTHFFKGQHKKKTTKAATSLSAKNLTSEHSNETALFRKKLCISKSQSQK